MGKQEKVLLGDNPSNANTRRQEQAKRKEAKKKARKQARRTK